MEVAGQAAEGRGTAAYSGYTKGRGSAAGSLGMHLLIQRPEGATVCQEFMGDSTCYYPTGDDCDTDGSRDPMPTPGDSEVSRVGEDGGILALAAT